jgi:hypothetical protein
VHVLARSALTYAAFAIALLGLAAVLAASVRVLPWLLDPTLPAGVAMPFARSLLTIALEAAVLTGWPVGWAIAMQRLADRGESRVFALLGESPRVTMSRLLPQGAALFALLFGVSYLGGLEAGAPGRVVNDLIAQSRTACEGAHSPVAYAVPFADVAWLCGTEGGPRLLGHPPGGFPSGAGGATFTAARVSVSGDLARVDLQDARIAAGPLRAHVSAMRIRGLVPFAHASTLPPFLRAIVVASSAAISAVLAGVAMLGVRVRGGWGRLYAGTLGVTGPLVALFLVRTLEQRLPDEPHALDLLRFALVPVAVGLAVLASSRASAALDALRKLARKRRG